MNLIWLTKSSLQSNFSSLSIIMDYPLSYQDVRSMFFCFCFLVWHLKGGWLTLFQWDFNYHNMEIVSNKNLPKYNQIPQSTCYWKWVGGNPERYGFFLHLIQYWYNIWVFCLIQYDIDAIFWPQRREGNLAMTPKGSLLQGPGPS